MLFCLHIRVDFNVDLSLDVVAQKQMLLSKFEAEVKITCVDFRNFVFSSATDIANWMRYILANV